MNLTLTSSTEPIGHIYRRGPPQKTTEEAPDRICLEWLQDAVAIQRRHGFGSCIFRIMLGDFTNQDARFDFRQELQSIGIAVEHQTLFGPYEYLAYAFTADIIAFRFYVDVDREYTPILITAVADRGSFRNILFVGDSPYVEDGVNGVMVSKLMPAGPLRPMPPQATKLGIPTVQRHRLLSSGSETWGTRSRNNTQRSTPASDSRAVAVRRPTSRRHSTASRPSETVVSPPTDVKEPGVSISASLPRGHAAIPMSVIAPLSSKGIKPLSSPPAGSIDLIGLVQGSTCGPVKGATVSGIPPASLVPESSAAIGVTCDPARNLLMSGAPCGPYVLTTVMPSSVTGTASWTSQSHVSRHSVPYAPHSQKHLNQSPSMTKRRPSMTQLEGIARTNGRRNSMISTEPLAPVNAITSGTPHVPICEHKSVHPHAVTAVAGIQKRLTTGLASTSTLGQSAGQHAVRSRKPEPWTIPNDLYEELSQELSTYTECRKRDPNYRPPPRAFVVEEIIESIEAERVSAYLLMEDEECESSH